MLSLITTNLLCWSVCLSLALPYKHIVARHLMWVVDYRTIHPRKFVFATFLKGFLWTGSIIQLNNEMLYHCLPILSMSSLQSPYHVPEIVIQHHTQLGHTER